MIEVLGWAGSALLVVSLLQSRMRLLRILNLLASLMLIGYNLALQVWPMVAMNTAVALINVWQLWRLHRAGVAPLRGAAAEPERARRARCAPFAPTLRAADAVPARLLNYVLTKWSL